MKFTISGPFEENLYSLMRKVGYQFQEENKIESELIFSRLLGTNRYPKFHLFVKTKDTNLIFNLHLDQKRPIYKGSHAHSAEYEGEVLEREAERIKQNLKT